MSGSAGFGSDPFYTVKSEVATTLDGLSAKVHNYVQTVQTTNCAKSNRSFWEMKRSLEKEIKGVETQIKELHSVLEHVEQNRSNFRHIDDQELKDRKQFVAKAKSTVKSYKGECVKESIKSKIQMDEKADKEKQKTSQSSSSQDDVSIEMSGLTNRRNNGNSNTNNFIEDQRLQSQLMLQEQDEGLEELGNAVTRVGKMAGNINETLIKQNKMLDDLGNDLDETSGRMDAVMKRLEKLLQTKDKCQIWTIVSLFLVLIVLVFLVIYT